MCRARYWPPASTRAGTGPADHREQVPGVAALTNTASIAPTSRGSSGGQSPAAGHEKHHDEKVAGRQSHNPTGRRGVPVTLSRIDHRQEPEDTLAQRNPCVLCPSGVVITRPQRTEGKAEVELADQDRLDGGQCGEDERASNARHPQQPHGLADEIVRGVPCRPLLHVHSIPGRWRPQPAGSAWSFQPTERLLVVEAGQGKRSRKVMESRTWRALWQASA